MIMVIRTAKISDKSVRLADYHREKVRSIPLDDSSEEEAGIELEAQVDEESELVLADGPEGEADGDTVESAEEEETAGEGDGGEAQNVAEVAEEEGHLTFTASQAEELVQERVKEFEARFQQEKEEAQRSGHEAGKADVLEDVLIAKRAKRAGLKLLVADGKELFSIRMYFGLKEIWFGWEKNMFFAMKESVVKATYNVAVVLGFVFTPYIILAINIFKQI